MNEEKKKEKNKNKKKKRNFLLSPPPPAINQPKRPDTSPLTHSKSLVDR